MIRSSIYVYMYICLSEGVGTAGVPHSISELEVRGCSKGASRSKVFIGHSYFLKPIWQTFWRISENQSLHASAQISSMIIFLQHKL